MDVRWEQSARVRMDTLSRGDRFLDCQGSEWTYVRRDGALSGVHHVRNARDEKTCFAGCAEVVLLNG